MIKKSYYRKGGRYYNPDITCIKVTFEMRDKLKALGRKGDTYNDILIQLIKKGKAKPTWLILTRVSQDMNGLNKLMNMATKEFVIGVA